MKHLQSLRRLLALSVLATSTAGHAADVNLLNAAYDVSRDVYKDLNPVFIADWEKAHPGRKIKVDQSHGGSSKQARAVIDGLEADFLATNNPLDVDAVAKAKLLGADWATKLPHQASPSWSTILFLVRKGNPKGIRDWNDLVKPGVGVVLPNPKTSGNGRYSYLAAWQYALTQPGGNEDKALAFVTSLIGNVPVLDTGGRGATTTFVQRGIGDVLLTFENELVLLRKEFGASDYEIVVPSLSIRADNPVAVVDKVAARKKTTEAAQAYAQFHFSEAAQEIFAANGLRPSDPEVLARHPDFADVKLFSVYNWDATFKKHFADGGTFDRIYTKQ
ncbi:MAG TPA: sulfate ABC transporter substrate-binding protein [Fontimonas sp.]